jgi:hypothetical protein
VSETQLNEDLAAARSRLLTRADTSPALNHDEDRGLAKRLALAALDWIAGGEREVPALLAALPQHDRDRVLAEAHKLGELIRARAARIADPQPGPAHMRAGRWWRRRPAGPR